jgi:hypothetical protein
MAYPWTFTFVFGSLSAGKTLAAQLYDGANAPVGAPITTGIYEDGSGGTYTITANIPNGHRGRITMYEVAVPGNALASEINPEVMEGGAAAAAAILATPGQKVTTDGSGRVTPVPSSIPTAQQNAEKADEVLTEGHGAGSWQAGGGAEFEVQVDHDTGGIDNLRYVDGGSGVPDGIIRAYLAEQYDAGQIVKRGEATTGSDGRWTAPMFLGAADYVLVFSKPGELPETIRRITVK